MVFLFSGSPPGQQIFVVDKEATIFENRWRKVLFERSRNDDTRAPDGHVIGPIVERIHAKIFLGELVDRIDGPPDVGPGEHHGPGCLICAPTGSGQVHGERFGSGEIVRPHGRRKPGWLADQDRHRSGICLPGHDPRPGSENAVEVIRKIFGCSPNRGRLVCGFKQGDSRVQHIRPICWFVRLRHSRDCTTQGQSHQQQKDLRGGLSDGIFLPGRGFFPHDGPLLIALQL